MLHPVYERPFLNCWFSALLVIISAVAPASLFAAQGDEDWDDRFSVAGFDGAVSQIISDSQGNVYAFGQFDYVDGIRADGLARWDGSSWSGLGVTSRYGYKAIALDANDNLYLAGEYEAGSVSIDALASWDGSSWTDLSSGFTGQFSSVQVASDGTPYAAGYFQNNGVIQYGVYRRVGATWGLVGGAFTAGAASFVSFADMMFDSNDNLIVGGRFGAVGTVNANSIASWDGSAWSAFGAGVTNDYGSGPTPGYISLVAENGAGEIFATGSFHIAGNTTVSGVELVKWSGGAWSQPFSGATDSVVNVRGLVFDNFDTLFIAATKPVSQLAPVYFWDGADWVVKGQPFSSSFDNSPVQSLTFNSAGVLFAVGGLSGESNGTSFSGITKFDGNNWVGLTSHVGQGANDRTFDLLQSSTGDTYVTGRYSSIGGKPIVWVTRWDGTDWFDLNGSSVNYSYVFSLATASNGDIYAGGRFFGGASGNSSSVGKWDGNDWSLVGTDTLGDIFHIVAGDNGVLYVSGSLWLNGASINKVAMWDGTAWSELGGGVTNTTNNAAIEAMKLTSSGDLLVSGKFTQAGNTPALNVALWDGSNWSALGSGLDVGTSSVLSIDEAPNGDIAAAGTLVTSAGNYETAPVAVWDGSNWNHINAPDSDYGQGTALAYDAQGELFVLGSFGQYSSWVSEGIGAWDGSQWRGFGSGLPSIDYPKLLSLQDGSLMVVGEFSAAGAKSSSNIARLIGATQPVVIQYCNGLPVTVDISLGDTATSGDDVILGTSGDDLIFAYGGNDTICGLAGVDRIFAGNGDDWVDAGLGDDEVQGSNGVDVIYGNEGNDYLAGGPGTDSIYGDNGDDTLYGNSGADLINGGDGVDQIKGGSGDDDIFTGLGGTVGTGFLVDGGAGDDTITGGADDDVIRGSSDNDVIRGGDGNDYLYGGGGEDQIFGESGDDLIRGNAANDILYGGDDDDNINGYGSKDTIYGGLGNDVLDGSTGNDLILGEAGDDTIRGGGGNDQVFGNAGVDTLLGGGGNDELDGGDGSPDSCDGQSGVDTAAASCETVANVP